MPSPRGAVSARDAIIKRIKQLAAAHARGDPLSTIVPAVLEVLQWADDVPVLKQEPTRKLMFSMKVPSKLLAIYTTSNSSSDSSSSKASSSRNRPTNSNRSASSSSGRDAAAPIITFAVILLLARFWKAVFGRSCLLLDEAERQRLKADAERQLRQAGLHEHFPAIVAAAVSTAAAAGEGIAGSAADAQAEAAAATARLGQQSIIALWQLLQGLVGAMGTDAWMAFMRVHTIPLLQLFLGFLQSISRQCEQDAEEPDRDVRSLFRYVFDMVDIRLSELTRHMCEACTVDQAREFQQYLPLLQSPYCMQVCALLTVIIAYAMLLSYQPLESLVDDVASSSSSSSALDEFEGHSHPLAAHAWSLARSRQHLLPASHGELLQLMGVSRAAAIWAAAQLNRARGFLSSIQQLASSAAVLHNSKLHVFQFRCPEAAANPAFDISDPAVTAKLQQWQRLQGSSEPWGFKEHAIQGLLPSVLLYWAHQTPADHLAFADSCALAGASCPALEDWFAQERLEGAFRVQQQQQQQQQGQQEEQRRQQQEQQQLGQPLSSDPSHWQSYAAEQIGLAMRLLSKLLSQVDSLSATQTSGSSSSSSSGSSNGTTTLQKHLNGLHYVVAVLGCLLQHSFCCTCVEHNQLRIAHLPTAGPCHWHSSAGPIWAQHSTQLFTLLEEYVRLDLPDITPSQVCSISALCKPPGLGASAAGASCLFAAAAEAGPGSTQQQQYCSLMCSLLKYAGRLQGQQQHQMLVEEVRLLVAHTSLMLTATNLLEPADQHGSSTGSNSGGSNGGGSSSSSSSSSGGGSSSHAPHSAGVACLPWLVLFGRCCTQWVEQHASEPGILQQQQQQGVLPRVECGIAEDMQLHCPNDVLDALNHFSKSKVEYKGLFMPLLAAWGHLLGSSLVAGGLAEVLQAEGYQDILFTMAQTVMPVYNRVQQGLAQAASLLREYEQNSLLSRIQVSARLAGLPEGGDRLSCDVPVHHVEMWGLVLTRIAIGCACNNPSCSNMAGTSELKLVKGSSRKCSVCRTARYCGSECQKQHWKQHKPVCKALANAKDGV